MRLSGQWPADLVERHPGLEELVASFSRRWRRAMASVVGRNPALAEEMRVTIGPEPANDHQWRALTAAARGWVDTDDEDTQFVPVPRRELELLLKVFDSPDPRLSLAAAPHELLVRDWLRALEGRIAEIGHTATEDEIRSAVYEREHEFHARLRAVVAYADRWRSGRPDGEIDDEDDDL